MKWFGSDLQRNQQRLRIAAAGLLVGLAWLAAACSSSGQPAATQTPLPASPAAATTEEAVTAEPSSNPEQAEASPTQAPTQAETGSKSTEYPPKNDVRDEPASSEAMAIAQLASRLGVSADQIKVVSTGDWTSSPLPCELEMDNPKLSGALQGEHRLVTLAIKGNTYQYWVFRSVAGLPAAFACKTSG